MSRFVPVLDAVWLVLKRNYVPRDVRRMIVRLVHRNQFDWETEELRNDRVEVMWDAWDRCGKQCTAIREMIHYIESNVEVTAPIPFPVAAEKDLFLQRVRVRKTRYLPPQFLWMWLRK